MVYNNTNTSIYRWEWFSIGLNVPINFIMLTQNNPYGKLPFVIRYPDYDEEIDNSKSDIDCDYFPF